MENLNVLSHQEIQSLHKQGLISVQVNMSAAMHICDKDSRMPGDIKAAHHFWKWLGILMLIGGPLSIFFISWYWGLFIFIASFPVMNATRQSAGQFVTEACLENESLYYECLQAGFLLVTKK